jgi:ferritin-like metal-binding protein YciE
LTRAAANEEMTMAYNALPNARDTKLIDWLDEAHANEVRLHASLNTELSSIKKPMVKKRLREHLGETEQHERLVAERIEQLRGGVIGVDPPAIVSAVGEAAGKAVAAVKGQIAARASGAGAEEAQVRVAQAQLREEHFEIALYTAIEAFAEEVGDADTAKLAKAILRDEQRTAKFLADQLPKLVRDLVRAEIPRAQRTTGRRRRGRTASAERAGRSAATRRSPDSRARS